MIDITPFQTAYQDQVVKLVLNIQQLEFNVPITAADQPDLLSVDEYYRTSGGEFWIAVHGDEVVGSIALIRIGNNAGVIRKMFVKKELRGKEMGIAQKLFNTLITYSESNNIENLYLGTIDRLHAAIRFYDKNGFEMVDKNALPADFPVMLVDNVFCKRTILKTKNQEI